MPRLQLYDKPVDGSLLVSLPRFQHSGRELRLIGRIGKVLALQAQRVPFTVHHTALAGVGPVQEVAGVELDGGLRGVDLHGATADRLVHSRRECE